MERVVAVIEARMGSSRLPGKSMRFLAGAPLVQRVAERAKRAKRLDDVVIATTTAPGDDVLAEHMRAQGFSVFRGSELDVLGRILGAAREHAATVHVQCWGDCPFLEPSELDRVVAALLDGGADIAGNALAKPRSLPYGLDALALRVGALEKADLATRENPYHREHGTTYIYETPGAFNVLHLETPEDLRYPALNVTINTEADYQFVTKVYDALFPENPRFGIRDVISLVRSRPDLAAHPNASLAGER